MWDGTPPGARRGSRGGDPTPSGRGPAWRGAPPAPRQRSGPGRDRANDPYRPYGEMSAPRIPAQRLAGGPRGLPPDPNLSSGGWTEAELQAVHHRRLGVAIFHDGNPGHLWRGELASRLGETVLAAGVIMWLYDLIGTPYAVALAVLALGVPFLLAPALVARFEQSPEPSVPLKWIGRLRFVFALGLIAMHYHTVLPVVYALLFIISLCGRLHDGARVAAMRTCLAPGEPEHVANDTHIGGAIAAVLGPLLATLSYTITGERILGVSIGAAVFFLISLNSESFLDALEPHRRAFLLATPETVAVDDAALDALAQDVEDEDDDEDPEFRRELKLPQWYQQGPETAGEAMADIRAGLALAGSTAPSSAAMWALCALALVGGGLSVLEVFVITGVVMQPAFYLGPLLAAEGAGVAVGVALAGGLLDGVSWRADLIVGLAGSGVALVALAGLRILPFTLLVALALGFANALGVWAARRALLHEFDPIERRAIAAADTWLTALCGVGGALFFTLAVSQPADVPLHVPARLMPAWPLPLVLVLMGVGLIVAGPLLIVLSARLAKRAARSKKAGARRTKGRGPARAAHDEELEQDESAYLPATGQHDVWDGEEADDGEWVRDHDAYAESYPAGDTGYDDAYDTGYNTGYDDYPGRGRDRSNSSRRPLPRDNRPRW